MTEFTAMKRKEITKAKSNDKPVKRPLHYMS